MRFPTPGVYTGDTTDCVIRVAHCTTPETCTIAVFSMIVGAVIVTGPPAVIDIAAPAVTVIVAPTVRLWLAPIVIVWLDPTVSESLTAIVTVRLF